MPLEFSVLDSGGTEKASVTRKLTPKRLLLTNVVQVVKSNKGTVGGWYIFNPNDDEAYVQFFNKTSGVTLGSTVPDMELGIPGKAGANVAIAQTLDFPNAIKVAATTTAGGNTAPAAALVANVFYDK